MEPTKQIAHKSNNKSYKYQTKIKINNYLFCGFSPQLFRGTIFKSSLRSAIVDGCFSFNNLKDLPIFEIPKSIKIGFNYLSIRRF